MKPEEWYRELISTITEPDVKRVASIMLSHVGEENAIELRQIALEAFWEYTTATERKTRIILERLVTEHGFAIGAYSGKSGRWLCKDDEEIQRVILDLQARKKSLDERISALRTAMSAQIRNQGRQLNFWR
jgi:hypothetical protein